jgi:hypothetical protein
VRQRCCQSRSTIDQPSGDEIAQHLIASVGINVDKALADERLPDVVTEIHEHLFPDSDGSRETHVVLIEPIVDDRHGNHQAIGTARGFLSDILHRQIVHVYWQVIAMLFDRRNRDDHDCLVLCGLLDLRPFSLASINEIA